MSAKKTNNPETLLKKVNKSASAPKYDHRRIEGKWQDVWEKGKVYSPKNMLAQKTPFYNLWMYPYPSAEGLHAGHAFASTGSDIYGRFMRMRGKDVFQPIGYDSFGLHSENFALKIGEHPAKMLARTTKNYERQLKSIGHGYDWQRTVMVSDIDYYRWTQWLMLQMFKAGLAYRKTAEVNWCPSCKTVLADEQIINGRCERCSSPTTKKELKQWFLRITDYASRLLSNLDKIDWSSRVVTTQKNWIGKKEGVLVDFSVDGYDFSITVFTTRIDTIFGATFIAVAPEYALEFLIDKIPADKKDRVKDFIKKALNLTPSERETENRQKSGADTGLKAVNPASGSKIPVFVADYVLVGYGTGAIMGVGAHDKRDWEFARKYQLPIVRVIKGGNENRPYQQEGVLINSAGFNGLDSQKAGEEILKKLKKESKAGQKIYFHLRDWLISRQRYWGPPIPFIYCAECAKKNLSWFSNNRATKWLEELSLTDEVKGNIGNNWEKGKNGDWNAAGWWPVAEEDLPLALPEITDFAPSGDGKGPLSKHPEFFETKCPHCGSSATRETDVSDTFVDSSWYFLAYPMQMTDQWKNGPKANKGRDLLVNEIIKKWLPVNLYFGGAEHSVLHLMYARFVNMVLYDLGLLTFEEPFPKFFAHGMVIKDGAKMSKSRGNVVNPDEYVEKFGADTLRMYLMFLGPMDSSPDFRDEGIEGMSRFVKRVWNLFFNYRVINPKDENKLLTLMHQTIKKVTDDIDHFRYNTALAQLMIFVNFMSQNGANQKAIRVLCLLLAPFAPHLTEEIWQNYLEKPTGGATFKAEDSIHYYPWPKFSTEAVKEKTVTILIQVNGKLRGQTVIDQSQAKNQSLIENRARQNSRVAGWLTGKVIKVIFVPGRLINFVVG